MRLTVHGPDPATEIFLIDASLQKIASAVGKLAADVTSGVYKLRYRSGRTQTDTLIEIPKGKSTHVVRAPPVQFRAAAPIVDTLTTHEYQAGPAQVHSRKAHHAIGRGSHVFMFVREIAEKERWRGCDVAVYSLNGERLAGIDVGVADKRGRLAAANIEVDPGTYAIRVTSADIGSHEMFVTTCATWQTQVFFSFEDFWKDGERARLPSIRQSSLFMAPEGMGFDPTGESWRTAELARQALAQGRDVLSEEVLNKILWRKYKNPMLGIIGAHLLLRRTPRDTKLLREVIANVRSLVGEHPDVVALQLAMQGSGGRKIKEVTAPPSLRYSWDEIARSTRRRASLVPAQGVVAEIAEDVVHAGLWLARRVSGGRRLPSASIADARRLATQLVAESPEALIGIARKAQTIGLPLTGIEQTVLGSFISFAKTRDLIGTKVARDSSTTPTAVRTVLSSVAAPKYVVANAVASLSNRLIGGLTPSATSKRKTTVG